MTTQRIPVDTLSVEQAVSWLQPHITTWTGYAFALAQKADLSPEAAAHIFMQPVLDEGQATFQANAAQLEQQANFKGKRFFFPCLLALVPFVIFMIQ